MAMWLRSSQQNEGGGDVCTFWTMPLKGMNKGALAFPPAPPSRSLGCARDGRSRKAHLRLRDRSNVLRVRAAFPILGSLLMDLYLREKWASSLFKPLYSRSQLLFSFWGVNSPFYWVATRNPWVSRTSIFVNFPLYILLGLFHGRMNWFFFFLLLFSRVAMTPGTSCCVFFSSIKINTQLVNF